MKYSSKAFSCAIMCVALLSAQSPSYAKLGSVTSAPAARPAPAPAMRPATVSQNRVGGGQSVGMQRPEVMQAARTTPPPAQQVTPVQSRALGTVPAQSPATTAGPGTPGWVKPALAGAAVGAIAGYALSNHGTPAQAGNQGYANNGYAPNTVPQEQYSQGQPHPQTQVAPQQQEYAPGQSSSGMGFFGYLVLFGLLVGIFLLWRKFYKGETFQQTMDNLKPPQFTDASSPAPVYPSAKTAIGLDYLQRFHDLQKWNGANNVVALQKATTPELFEILKPSIGAGQTTVLKLSGEILDVTTEPHQTVASVRFTGVISENGGPDEALDEVWHFVQVTDNHDWFLAGIEQT